VPALGIEIIQQLEAPHLQVHQMQMLVDLVAEIELLEKFQKFLDHQ
jgi:hypothetical protein